MPRTQGALAASRRWAAPLLAAVSVVAAVGGVVALLVGAEDGRHRRQLEREVRTELEAVRAELSLALRRRTAWLPDERPFDVDDLVAATSLGDAVWTRRFGVAEVDHRGRFVAHLAGVELSPAAAVTTHMVVPGSIWRLTAVPRGGWPARAPATRWIVVTGGAIALIAGAATALAIQYPRHLRRRIAAATEELARRNAELEGFDRFKNEFIAVASHELRTPLTTIRGFTLTLARNWHVLSDADRLRCFEAINRQTGRLAQLVDDLVVSSELDAGTIASDLEVVRLADVVEAARQATGLEVGVTTSGDLDRTVLVERTHLERVLSALLSNAAKYGAPPIEVSASVGHGELVVSVRDHGPGVPETFRPHLFERFSQASTGSTRTAVGTGMGLAVALGLARAAGGDVWYVPAPGGGASFGVRLPATATRESPAGRAGDIAIPELVAS